MDNSKHIKKDTITELFNLYKTHPNTKISKQSVQLFQEYLNVMTSEAIHRAYEEADKSEEGSVILDVNDLESIVQQLLMDF